MNSFQATVAVYGTAARSFAHLVHRIPVDRWAGPGLDQWDLRSLVGHTSRSLITVESYLDCPAEHEDIATPAEYYARAMAVAAALGPSGIVERGRQAGRELGDDPPRAVDALVESVLSALAGSGDRLIAVIGGLGIRLQTYLPTRTFELAVHSLDIAAAAGVPLALPQQVLQDATVLAAQIAVASGSGEAVLRTLTGRARLAPEFSVV
jgi:hypothetical protein